MSKNMPFVYFFYMCSFVMFFSFNEWFCLWLSLELNSAMFISMLVGNKSAQEMGGALSYFMIQSTTSLILIFSVFNIEIMNTQNLSTPKMAIILALMMKLSSVPFHSWMPAVMMSTSKKMSMWLLLTMQKMMPLMLLMSTKPQMSVIVILCVLTSAFMGPLLNMSQSISKSLLAYSSFSHTSWLIMACVLCQESWMLYYMSYSLMLVFLTKNLKYTMSQQNSNTSQYNSIMTLIILLGMGGLPPFMGFFPKMMILNSTLSMSMTLIAISLIVSSATDMFIYTRMTYYGFINKKSSIVWMKTENKLSFVIVLMSIILLSVVVVL